MRPALAVALLVASACAPGMATPTPMTSVRDLLEGDRPAKCLVVFLPGVGDSAKDFERHGFIEALRAKQLSVDVVAANATLGYYLKGLFIERLDEDVIAPARARGYQHTWLVGISMGGMGGMGALVLAPFLGSRELSDEIRAAGGLAWWKAPEGLAADGHRAERDGPRALRRVGHRGSLRAAGEAARRLAAEDARDHHEGRPPLVDVEAAVRRVPVRLRVHARLRPLTQ